MSKVQNPISVTVTMNSRSIVVSSNDTATTYINASAVEMIPLERLLSDIKKLRKQCKERGIKLVVRKNTLDAIKETYNDYLNDVRSYNSVFRSVLEDWRHILERGLSPIGGAGIDGDIARRKMDAVAPLLHGGSPISMMNDYNHRLQEFLRGTVDFNPKEGDALKIIEVKYYL
jgi:hypothetical protein